MAGTSIFDAIGEDLQAAVVSRPALMHVITASVTLVDCDHMRMR